ncbi:MAG: TRAP transporter large permease [Deltaproteobacteria bacterium]|nr:TRAP transporter large permease [Deltaproteobacteria bacterium]
MNTILMLILLAAILIRIPLSLSLGFACLVVLLITENVSVLIMPQRMFAGIDSFSLLAIPFFLLAGNLMSASGITQRVLAFANSIVGRFPGGLAMTNIVTNIFFGGISGSAVADCAAIGSIMMPAMMKEGYDKAFTVAVNANAAIVAPIIPPSILFVMYGVLTGQSITRLFVAGAVPGVLIGLGFMFVAYFVSKRRNYPRHSPASFREILVTFKDSALAILMPLFILGGIVTGVFTVTECSAMAVVYALIVGVLVYRGLKLKDLIAVIRSTCHTTAIIMLIVGMAKAFSWLMINNRLPESVASFILQTTSNPIVILMLINVVLLIAGCFMEANAILVMFIPVLYPLTQMAGIDPIHFGVIACVNLCVGLVTPPVGLTLNLSCQMTDCKLEDGAMESLPFLAIGFIGLLVLTYYPPLSLVLPGLLMR